LRFFDLLGEDTFLGLPITLTNILYAFPLGLGAADIIILS